MSETRRHRCWFCGKKFQTVAELEYHADHHCKDNPSRKDDKKNAADKND